MQMAFTLAKDSLLNGWVPIAAVLAAPDGRLSLGRNQRVQGGSLTRHAEIDAIENWGRSAINVLPYTTMYITRIPCVMCTGAIAFARISRIVIADRRATQETLPLLQERNIEVCILDDKQSNLLMTQFRESYPAIWLEDRGGLHSSEE